jgi:hypothetical protein
MGSADQEDEVDRYAFSDSVSGRNCFQWAQHPHNWELLSKSNKLVYTQLHQALSAPKNRDRRQKCADDWWEMLEAIAPFGEIDDDDRWKRWLVCGVFRFPGGIAVNCHQLTSLVLGCKTLINGSLKRLGYTRIASKLEGCELLFKAVPFLRIHGTELRKWTLRYLGSAEEKPSACTVDTTVATELGASDSDAWIASCTHEDTLLS